MIAERLEHRLIAILERERRQSRASLRESHALDVDERAAAGDAVPRLELMHKRERLLELRCGENLSRFRDGDLLWLSDGREPRDGLEVVLRDYDPARGLLHVEVDRHAEGQLQGRRDLVLDRRELDLTDRMIRAIHAALSDPRSPTLGLLSGERPAGASPLAADFVKAEQQDLDEEQGEALARATTLSLHLIQGPPGAGKTRVAAAIVRAFTRSGLTVLVSAFTHRAVNQLLAAIAAVPKPPRVVKIGPTRSAEELGGLGIERIARARDLKTAPFTVVGCTTQSAAGLGGTASPPFDVVLVDEAGQVSLAHAASVLPLGRRHVIVGDHQQLPPLTLAEHHDPLASRSLFEHLHALYGSQMLTTTYRLNEELASFPSRAFYDGRLHAAASCRDRRLAVPESVGAVLGPRPAAVIVPMSHRGARIVAPEEAAFAAAVVLEALRLGVVSDEIAVIAPHRAQGNRIRTLLRARLPDLGPDRQPLVDTVERLQGGERDLVVLSLTASDPEASLAQAGFLFSPNRLNVSLTRARKKLVILMSEALLDAFPDDARALHGSELLRRLWRDLPHASARDIAAVTANR